jgi:PIN domain nuclease of toxin-antitoxin system
MHKETDYERVVPFVAGGALSSVNLAEIASKFVARGASEEATRSEMDLLPLEIIPFDRELALASAALYRSTRRRGLSLGDRACLATAQALGIPAVTAERAWIDLGLSIPIHVIR